MLNPFSFTLSLFFSLSLSPVYIFHSCARVLFVIIIKNRLALTRNRNGMKTWILSETNVCFCICVPNEPNSECVLTNWKSLVHVENILKFLASVIVAHTFTLLPARSLLLCPSNVLKNHRSNHASYAVPLQIHTLPAFTFMFVLQIECKYEIIVFSR